MIWLDEYGGCMVKSSLHCATRFCRSPQSLVRPSTASRCWSHQLSNVQFLLRWLLLPFMVMYTCLWVGSSLVRLRLRRKSALDLLTASRILRALLDLIRKIIGSWMLERLLGAFVCARICIREKRAGKGRETPPGCICYSIFRCRKHDTTEGEAVTLVAPALAPIMREVGQLTGRTGD